MTSFQLEFTENIAIVLLTLRLLGEWHEVNRKSFFSRQLEGFMPSAACWQLDRNGSNPTPSLAGLSFLAATPTMMRGTQSLDTAVYWSLTSCHSCKTTFPCIFDLPNRVNCDVVCTINIRTPTETVKIVGLFARSRGNYAIYPNLRFDRGLFYLVLARHRLLSMWRYFSACVEAETIRKDATLYLAQSILVRATRALEARDAIGEQFYLPQSNSTRNTMMYHFDYLTLLLVGAFDAQARVAHRAYGITKPVKRRADFRWQDYQEALKHNGATNLCSIISGQYFKGLMTLLHELRNTIHGADFPTVGYHHAFPEPQASYITVLPDYRQKLWQAATQYSSPDHWGLVQQHTELRLEPYTYSITLIDECFKYIDAIAAATDIEKLFPSGHTIPPLLDQPPETKTFGKKTRHRLAILG